MEEISSELKHNCYKAFINIAFPLPEPKSLQRHLLKGNDVNEAFWYSKRGHMGQIVYVSSLYIYPGPSLTLNPNPNLTLNLNSKPYPNPLS